MQRCTAFLHGTTSCLGLVFIMGLAIVGFAETARAQDDGNVDMPRYPSISPDGSEIVFSWRGDLWKIASTGGHATRLTSHPADDLRSVWSPDGQRIAFSSNRTGFNNLHMMNADGTNIAPVSELDRSCQLVDFGTDGDGNEVLTFSSTIEGDVYRGTRPYMISTSGGDVERVHDAFGAFPAISRDGTRVLFTRGGSRWERRHYMGPDDRDVWMFDRRSGAFAQLTFWEGNDGQARWMNRGEVLFLSDRELDCVNLYRMDVSDGDEGAVRLTSFTEHDIWSYHVSLDGDTAVVNAWDTLYTIDLRKRQPTVTPLVISANEDERDNFTLRSINRDVDEAALSPDGQVMAFVAYGEIYVRNVDEDSPTRRVTESHARDHGIAWSPDGLKLYFVSDRDGTESIYAATVDVTRGEVKSAFEEFTNPEPEEDPDATEEDEDSNDEDEDSDEDGEGDDEEGDEDEEDVELPLELQPDRWHDAMTFNIEPVLVSEHQDREPNPSPDGTMLAFRRSRGDLSILDLDTGDTRVLAPGWDTGVGGVWSPDSTHFAYQQDDINFNTDIWIVPTDGSSEDAVNITRHPDNDMSPQWSADGKILTFISERVNEETDVWMVYLDKDLEALTALERKAYYEDAAKAASKRAPLEITAPDSDADDDEDESDDAEDDETAEPMKLDLDDAYLRLRRVTTFEGSEYNNHLTPGGDWYIFTRGGESSGTYAHKWDGSDTKRLSGPSSVMHVSLTGDKVVVVSGGQGGHISIGGGNLETVGINDEIRVDLQAQSSQKFNEAARILGEMFYHPEMKGLDWDELTERYHALAMNTRRANEFNEVANRLIGELNGSHLSISAPADNDAPNRKANGRLGTEHRRVDDGYEVTRVVPEGPAAKGPMRLQVGDVITAIDFEPIGERDTIESRLKGRSGEEVVISIRRMTDDGDVADLNVLMTPTSYFAERSLKYEAWQRDAKAMVHELSDGRLGYIHIQGMNQPSLDEFERDLYASAEGKDGLIIDVRNNGGGWTTDRLLASIMVQPHAYTIPRGADPSITNGYPQDRLFIQRYTLPINTLCNEKSFSNAEIFSHAFKALERGTLVGQQTYGGVISTGGTSLIDGTWVRLPFRGWYLLDGTDMENNGAIPDIVIDQTPESEATNDDIQLKAAVEDLLNRLP